MSNTSDSAAEVFDRLKGTGHDVEVTADRRLAVTGASTLTDDDRRLIRAHKADLLRWLEPDTRFGPQAATDARTLAAIIDGDPTAELDVVRAGAGAMGITGQRFAFALAALPERLDRAGWGE